MQTYAFYGQHFGSETEYGLIAKSYRVLIVTYCRGFKKFGN